MIHFRLTRHNRNSAAAVIAACEEKLHEHVNILQRLDKQSIQERFAEKDVVLYSFMTPYKAEAITEIKAIKAAAPGVVVIAGGAHPSGDPQDCIAAGCDYVVKGEGEETLPVLITDITTLGGGKEKIIEGQPVDINAHMPFPAGKPELMLYIELTRGCAHGCTFCQTSVLFGKKPRHRNVENVLKAVDEMLKCGYDDIRFVTPNALSYGSETGKEMNVVAVENLLKSVRKAVKKKGRIFFGSFPSEIRPDFISAEAIEVIKKYCDNDNLIIGAQSGSDKVLKNTNRQHNAGDVIKAVNLALKAGFKVNADFIFGFPFETDADAEQSLRLMEALIDKGVRIHAHKLQPLAGTPYYKEEKIKIRPALAGFLKRNLGKGKVYGTII